MKAVALALALLSHNAFAFQDVDELIAQMTLEEKITYLGGAGMGNYPDDGRYVGTVWANDRLGVPALLYNDGPQGFRDDARPGTTTAFPSGLTLAATFDVDMATAWGSSMGKEFFDKGANVILGPGMNVARVPVNGRNFEYMSGEDPYLGATLVGPVIEAIQSNKILANAKHFVNNNQETNRMDQSANVDERTRYEMYYPPFQAAIDAGVGSFMCSYNKINHVWSCENPETLKRDLKGKMGFEGFVMSDWGATHSPSLMEGLDQEMADADFMNYGNLSGMPIENIDESVKRILKPFIDVGNFDLTPDEIAGQSIYNNVTSDEHFNVARQISAASHVLVKNDNGVLPLTKKSFWSKDDSSVAVFGNQASEPTVGGGGSGYVSPSWLPTPLATIHATLAQADYGAESDNVFFGDDDTSVEDMQALASKVDVCFFFLATSSSEGGDRANLNLDADSYVSEVAPFCAQSVAVVTTPGAVLMPWANQVDAILVNFMPGVAAAFATMDVVVGDVNPSARLPITMPMVENQEGMTTEQYPGLDDAHNSSYTEKWAFGYRYYHLHNEQPRFWFGDGLSYTDFTLETDSLSWNKDSKITAKVTNAGDSRGAVVPQLYLSPPAACDEPLFMLKGFEKLELDAGESQTVTFKLTDRDLSTWSVDAFDWARCSGNYTARVSLAGANFGGDSYADVTRII